MNRRALVFTILAAGVLIAALGRAGVAAQTSPAATPSPTATAAPPPPRSTPAPPQAGGSALPAQPASTVTQPLAHRAPSDSRLNPSTAAITVMPPRSPDPASLGRFARAAGAIRPMSPTRDRPTAPSERGTIAAARPVNAAFLNSNGFDGADITSNCLVASPCALWIAPPDVSVAVGPSQVVETTNLVLH